jgi:hypothetical protein
MGVPTGLEGGLCRGPLGVLAGGLIDAVAG